MSQRILIISTRYTGHGHQSMAESINEQLLQLNPHIKTEIIEGFDLGGKLGWLMGHLYGPMTQYARPLWASCYHTFGLFPGIANMNTTLILRLRKELMRIITKTNPDLIVTVHPGFVGSIINILEKYHLEIPVIPVIADLVSINPLWADNRAYHTICPSEEAKDRIVKYGISEKRISLFKFPIRQKFISLAAGIKEEDLIEYRPPADRRLNFLLVSGAEGAGNLAKTAQTLLDNFDCKVTIITGRNKQLRSNLESSLSPKYPDRAVILGFVSNIETYLIASDLLITRASPNTMMEAVACCVPLVVTDAVPGQEKENPSYIVKHGLGITCKDISLLPREIKGLWEDNCKRLMKIRYNQFKYRDLETSKKIAAFLLNIAESRWKSRMPGAG